MMEPSRSYRIGEVAHQTGVSVETLRYYEKRRLLKSPQRTDGGFRMYSDAVVGQVRFIKQAQSLGLTLEDIQQLVAGQKRRNHAPSCRKVRDLLTRRIDDIDARIEELEDFRRTLHEHRAACERALSGGSEPPCPTIEALDRPRRSSKTYEARESGDGQ
jgi:MerR family transcriptional regulator, mercuric resistance operon regulatory protein